MNRRLQVALLAPGLLAGLGALAGCSWFSPPLSGKAAEGQALFAMHCAECHEGEHPDLHKQPPKLNSLFQSKALPSGAPATDAQVRKTIIEGRATMPAFDQRLNDQEVDDLLKYLHTLR